MELLPYVVAKLVDNDVDETFIRRYVTMRPVYSLGAEPIIGEYFIAVWPARDVQPSIYKMPFDWDAIKNRLRRTKKNI